MPTITIGGNPITTEQATAIRAALGIPEPENVTLAKSTLVAGDFGIMWDSEAGAWRRVTAATLATYVDSVTGGGGVTTEPAAFTAGQWTLSAGDGQATLNITALPSDGGSAITALEYRLDGGSAVALTGTGTGARTIASLTNGTSYAVQVRAVNAIGNGAWSDTKNVTPVAAGSGATALVGTPTEGESSWGTTVPMTVPAGLGVGDRILFMVSGLTGAAPVSATDNEGHSYVNVTPGSGFGTNRHVFLSEPLTAAPTSVTLTMDNNDIMGWSLYGVEGVASGTNPTVNSGTSAGAGGFSTDPRAHTYTTTTVGEFVLGVIDFEGGGVTGATGQDVLHDWRRLGSYGSRYARALGAAGSYTATLGPSGAGSTSVHYWLTLGAA